MRRTRTFVCALVLLLGMGWAARAQADDAAARAAAHARQAKKLFELGQLRRAIEIYGKAYEANPLAKYLYNVGLCRVKIGTLDELKRAELSFAACKRKATSAALRQAASRKIEHVRKRIRELTGGPPPAVKPPPVKPPPVKPPPVKPPAVKPPEVKPPPPASAPASADADTPSRKLPLWTIVTASAAVAFTALGVGMSLAARSSWQEYGETTDEHRYDELRDEIPLRSTVANVSFGLAGAAALSSALIYLLVERHRPEQPATRVGIGPAGVRLTVEF